MFHERVTPNKNNFIKLCETPENTRLYFKSQSYSQMMNSILRKQKRSSFKIQDFISNQSSRISNQPS